MDPRRWHKATVCTAAGAAYGPTLPAAVDLGPVRASCPDARLPLADAIARELAGFLWAIAKEVPLIP